MSYTVLARKYRSPTFADVVGQEAVTTTLKNAIQLNRVHHGYLFCGTRGVGKTSMARILAKSLNCLASDHPTVTPCGACDSCRGIAEGEDIDVLEIDAASNTGVENIRELRSNAVFRPARSRFKIYIIDEVHMLSTGAFNALLKTLEEPPEHVKFILATTDPQKVPATIHSRCQRFEFKSIPPDQIANQLRFICERENVTADPAALKRLARLANGSLRDAISLLDQVLSVCGAELTAQGVDEFLPPAHDEAVATLIDHLADGDAAAVLRQADRSLGEGQTIEHWVGTLIAHLRDRMLLAVCGPDSDMVDLPAAVRPRAAEQSRRFDPPAYVFMISVLEELRRAVKTFGAGRALLEAGLVRLADSSKFASIEALLAKLDEPPSAAANAAAAPAARPASAPVRPYQPPPDASAPLSDDPKKKAPPPAASPRRARPTDTPAAPVQSAASRDRPADPTPAPRRSADSAIHTAARDPLPAAGRPRTDDIRAVMSDPLVRSAIDIFDGKLVNVHRPAAAPVTTVAVEAPDEPEEPLAGEESTEP